MLPGKIATLLVIATILSVIGALLVAWRYRLAMQALMKAPLTTIPAARLPYAADAAPVPVTLADNRQAERRLILAFLGITLVMALIRTLLMQMLANGPITLITVSTLCAAYAWPVVPVVAVIRRWSRWRFVGALLLFPNGLLARRAAAR